MSDRPTWLRVPDEAELPPEVLALWQAPREKLGFVPNVLRFYALRPSRLLAWNAHYEEAEGRLDPDEGRARDDRRRRLGCEQLRVLHRLWVPETRCGGVSG